jgi:ERCC4-type nuclease
MRPVCRIAVDIHERRSGIGDRLREMGAEVAFRPLAVGDYDFATGVLVERKTTADLHLSLQRGRFWRQIGRLREAARLPYLLLEGERIDDRAIGREAIRGACLAVVGQGVPIIWSRDAADSALWLWLLAHRVGGLRPGRDRPAYAQRLKPPPALVSEAMLAAVPSISVGIARALLAEFGNLAAIVAAPPERWLDVRGFGVGRARALERALHG